MKSLRRNDLPASSRLLTRILERPELVAAVRQLPGAVLGQLIDRIGLEDAGELVALATAEQLQRVLDDDLWRAEQAGGDETFRPERFALWLRVMLEGGEQQLAQRLCELPQDLLALAIHRLVLVLDMDVVAEQLSWAGDEAAPIEQALESATCEEWEEFRLLARDRDVWDDVWTALLSLDRDHHPRLRAILEQCCAMSTEYISGQGGLFQVLTADEMLDSDVAAVREDRRAGEGFVSPADARAFLQLARLKKGDQGRDPITRAYFRALLATDISPPGEALPNEDWAAFLREVEAIPPAEPSRPLLGSVSAWAAAGLPAEAQSKVEQSHLVAPLFEQAMNDLRARDAACFSTRVRELGYLVNVWMAGADQQGRRPRPMEALEVVLRTCDAGLRNRLAPGEPTASRALALLVETPLDLLFRSGFRG